MFASSTCPSGYLAADGADISTTTYSALFAVTGYTFGGSGGNFRTPNMQGVFARGYDAAGSTDTARAFGSFQEDEIKAHAHTINLYNHAADAGGGTPASSYGSGTENTTSLVGGTETRPKNIALQHCVRY